jgi:hypothetical protein
MFLVFFLAQYALEGEFNYIHMANVEKKMVFQWFDNYICI